MVFDDRKNVRRQVLFQDALVVFNCRIFTAFTFGNDRSITSTSHNGFDVHPPAMKRSGDAARRCRTPTELPDFRPEFRCKLRSLYRAPAEQRLEVRVLDVLRGRLKPVLAVPADLYQIIQTLYEF